MELKVNHDLFLFRDAGKTLKINSLWLLARCRDAVNYNVVMTPPLPESPDNVNLLTLVRSNQYGSLHFAQKEVAAFDLKVTPEDSPLTWQLKMTRSSGGDLQVEDLYLILGYEWD